MTALIILTVGLTGAIVAGAISISRSTDVDLVDPTVEKRWLVRYVARHPRLADFVRRRLDRTTAGGLLLTLGFLAVLGLATFAGWIFDTLDESRGFAEFDRAVAEFGAGSIDTTTARILDLITDLGGTGFVVVFSVAVALYGWWRTRNRHVAFFVLAAVAGQAVVNNGLKWIVERERPAIEQLTGWAGSSFPSGHSAAAAATFAAAALVLSLGRSRRTRALLAAGAGLLATMVGATRALLGVHWLTDVLAGLAVGWACFIVAAVAFGGHFMVFGEPKDEVELEGAIREGAVA